MIIPASLQAAIQSSTVELCRLYWIRRRDGVEYLLTDWALPLVVTVPVGPTGVSAGEIRRFVPFQSPNVAALANDVSLSVSNSEYESYYSLTGISPVDIRANRFDGAEVLFYIYCPSLPDSCWLAQSGYAGALEDLGGELFKMSFRSIAQLLQKSVGKTVAEFCPYRLGESRCGYTPATVTAEIVHVTAGAARRDIIVSLNSPSIAMQVDRFWQYGLMEITTSASQNTGLQGQIIFSDYQGTGIYGTHQTRLKMLFSLPFDFVVGENVRLMEGCANTVAACSGRNNIINYGGFPHLPGIDRLLAAGQRP